MSASLGFLFAMACLCLHPILTSEAPALYANIDLVSLRTAQKTLLKGEFFGPDPGGIMFDFECELCKIVSSALELYMEKNSTEEYLAEFLTKFCIVTRIEDKNVCDLVVQEFKDEVLSVAYWITLGQAKQACSILIGPSCQPSYDPWRQYWNVTIPGNKPPITPIPDPKPGSPVSHVLHLSDIHWDQNYTAGLSNDCGEPICCRPPNKAGNVSTAAGYWGDYNCDLPYSTFIDLMEHLVSIKDQFDWVYVTGDLPAHNVWNQSRNDQLFILNTITSLMKHYLPEKIFYFTLGNHESVPVNSFPPPFIKGKESNQWLLDAAANAWMNWLTPESIATVFRGGFYNQKVRDGLRVISLQTNFGSSMNYWLLLNDTDPGGQLAWLIEQLLEAEHQGDKVHIIGHFPPGRFTHSFGVNYNKIINRFENTVVGQFFGHTHRDEFEIFSDGNRTTNFAYIGPSVTVDGCNPAFRIYTLDGDYQGTSSAVLDYTTYYLNISDSRVTNKTKWLKEYSAKDTYNMKSLHPSDWADLVERFKSNDTLFQLFYQYKYTLHPHKPVCDAACKHTIICDLTNSIRDNISVCDKDISMDRDITMTDVEWERFNTRGTC